MSRDKIKKGDSERGSQMVEFALILPVLVLFTFGAIDFGIAVSLRHVIVNAAREGARSGIVGVTPKPTSAQIQTTVQNAIDGTGWHSNQATITVTGAGGASGTDLQVHVLY